MKKPSSKFCYIVGIILIVISLVLIIFGVTLPLINKEINYLGWIGLLLTSIGIIIFITGIYYLKKGNYLKLNNHLINNHKEHE